MPGIKRHSIEDFKARINLDSPKREYFLKEFTHDDEHPEEPYRTETFGIGYVKKGQLFLTTGLTDHHIESPAIITMGPNVIRKWTRTYKTVLTDTIFFTKEFLISAFANGSLLSNIPYFEQADLHVFQLEPKEEAYFKPPFAQLKKYVNTNLENKDHIVRQYIAILYFLLDEQFRKRKINSNPQSADIELIQEFKELGAKEIKNHKDVGYYAAQLNITPKNLSQLVKRATGKTASQFLHGLLILEAKILLQNPAVTVSQIAYGLSFPDPSSFGKYFKKYAGCTPATYRSEVLTI